MVFLGVGAQLIEAPFAVPRVERAIYDETIGIGLLHRVVALDIVETFFVEVGQVGRLQDRHIVVAMHEEIVVHGYDDMAIDRKSTRLNSSHTVISYSVFCLKKKKST